MSAPGLHTCLISAHASFGISSVRPALFSTTPQKPAALSRPCLAEASASAVHLLRSCLASGFAFAAHSLIRASFSLFSRVLSTRPGRRIRKHHISSFPATTKRLRQQLASLRARATGRCLRGLCSSKCILSPLPDSVIAQLSSRENSTRPALFLQPRKDQKSSRPCLGYIL